MHLNNKVHSISQNLNINNNIFLNQVDPHCTNLPLAPAPPMDCTSFCRPEPGLSGEFGNFLMNFLSNFDQLGQSTSGAGQVADQRGGQRQVARGGPGNDKIVQRGGRGNDRQVARGGRGNDKIVQRGGAGNDVQRAFGGPGHDRIVQRGGRGNDRQVARGGRGNDTIIQRGGPGNDVQRAFGGPGNDKIIQIAGR